MQPEIKYLGTDKLDEFELSELQSLCNRHLKKLESMLTPISPLFKVHVKVTNAEGRQKNFLIKLTLTSPELNLSAEQSDWDLKRTFHKVYENIANQAKKKLKL
ncbi:hypothetical protein D6777_00030 [Candidatus Woesearchaeota archaeon]|nr:MAG: hypothetical protein D6777_00030 [Candidatus Woesearchaeota archaeon]